MILDHSSLRGCCDEGLCLFHGRLYDEAGSPGILDQERLLCRITTSAQPRLHLIRTRISSRPPQWIPGTYTTGEELMRPFQKTHRHAVLMLDAQWDGSPGAAAIRTDLSNRILVTGWPADAFKVIVIEPELEAWIWQRNQRLATALKFGSVAEMVKAVHDAKVDWPNGQAKPSRPKEALEAVATRKRKIGYSSALHRAITTTISLAGCRDNAFLELRQTLQRWFPLEIQP